MADGVNEVLGQSGPKPTITHNGKMWEIAHPIQNAKAHFTAIITANAIVECKALKGVVPDETYGELWDALTNKISAKHFRTLNAGWLAVMQSMDADVFFLLSLLRIKHPEATEEDARELFDSCREEVAAAFAQVVPGFLDCLAKDWPPQIPQAKRKELLKSLHERFVPPTT